MRDALCTCVLIRQTTLPPQKMNVSSPGRRRQPAQTTSQKTRQLTTGPSRWLQHSGHRGVPYCWPGQRHRARPSAEKYSAHYRIVAMTTSRSAKQLSTPGNLLWRSFCPEKNTSPKKCSAHYWPVAMSAIYKAQPLPALSISRLTVCPRKTPKYGKYSAHYRTVGMTAGTSAR